MVATGKTSVFLPRVLSMPAPATGRKSVTLDDARANMRDGEGAKGSEDTDTGSAFSVSVAAGSTSANFGGVHNAFADEEGVASCGDSCGDANGGRTSPESGTYGVPLDILLYSLKDAAGEKAKGLSAVEKLKGLRALCLHLAGQDPGDVHEALRLESGPNASTNVSVSDGFLKKVRCSMPRLYRSIGCAQYQPYARVVILRASYSTDEQSATSATPLFTFCESERFVFYRLRDMYARP